MQSLNKALLCGTVPPDCRIRSFTTKQGRLLCFELMTMTPGSGRCEYHSVVARDGGGSDLASRSEAFVSPGSMVFVTGMIRYRMRAGYGAGRVTEIDATAIDPVWPGDAPQEGDGHAESLP